MKSMSQKRTKLVLLVAIAAVAMTTFVATPEAAFKNPSGVCTTTSCDYILDNVTPPGFTGGPSNTSICVEGKENEWHFVLTQLNNPTDVTAPATIVAVFLSSPTNEILLVDVNKTVDDPEVGYTLVNAHLTDTLLGAFATISGLPEPLDADLWPGRFNLSHAPCTTSPPPQVGSLTACKYYDFNANGVNNSESPLAGWPMTIDPVDGASQPPTQGTNAAGCVTWTPLAPGTYTVTEGVPNEDNWVNSDPGNGTFAESASVVQGETSRVEFGNYCTEPSGGNTPICARIPWVPLDNIPLGCNGHTLLFARLAAIEDIKRLRRQPL